MVEIVPQDRLLPDHLENSRRTGLCQFILNTVTAQQVEGQCEGHYKLELDNILLRQKVRHNYSKNLLNVAYQIVRTQE